jgi:hypothetical protein
MRTCVFLLLILLAACDSGKQPTSVHADIAPPVTDTSTPDRTLKSYWAVRDYVLQRERLVALDERPKYEAARRVLDTVAAAPVASAERHGRVGPIEVFSRDIVEVKVESESRAVATAIIRNISPIPPGAEVHRFEEEQRREGERLRYVLEKEERGWRVAEVWVGETYPTAGWKKAMPVDDKPYVPTGVWEAR